MINIIERIKTQIETGFPFAVYSKPGSLMVTGIFQNDPGIYPVNFEKQAFIFAPFNNGKTIFIPAEASDVLSVEINFDSEILNTPAKPAIDAVAKAGFEALVAKSIAAIKEGGFQKLVVSRTETVALAGTGIISIFLKLLQAYPNAFNYFFYDPYTGLWMGATPEQLLKVENHTLHTVALAGTQLYKEGERAVWEEKEKQEQQFVTDYILNKLNPYVVGIQATEPYTFRAGNIVHIKTDISAELKQGNSLENVIKALHPTPAVCGLPKAAAQQFLVAHEGYNREYYAGFLGEVNRDFNTGQHKTDLFVNLRCMKIQENKAHLYIGCGITKDSDPEKEFLETVNKSMTMRKVL